MRCSCCNKVMTDKEIQWNKQLNTWELCTVCLDAAVDAAYSDGHDLDEDDLLFVPLSDDYFDVDDYSYRPVRKEWSDE